MTNAQIGFLFFFLTCLANAAEIKVVNHFLRMNVEMGQYEDQYEDIGVVDKVTLENAHTLKLTFKECYKNEYTLQPKCYRFIGFSTEKKAVAFSRYLSTSKDRLVLESDYWNSLVTCKLWQYFCQQSYNPSKPKTLGYFGPVVPARLITVRPLEPNRVQ